MELESIVVSTTTNGNGAPAPAASTGAQQTSAVTSVISNPTIIENKNWRFLIMDSPTDANVQAYVKMLQKKNVVAVVLAHKLLE